MYMYIALLDSLGETEVLHEGNEDGSGGVGACKLLWTGAPNR